MPAKNADLHGNVPEQSAAALLLIDVINDLEFPEGEQMLPQAISMAQAVAALKERCREQGIPAIYVNDNFGRWRSDFQVHVNHCLRNPVRGRPVVEILRPQQEDYFVLKPKHSGFFSTTLDTLLSYLKARSLILAGIAGDNCVLFTANDAYMRDYQLLIPSDCVASATMEDNRRALSQMARLLKADIRPSTDLDISRLLQEQ